MAATSELRETMSDPVPRLVWGIVVGAVVTLAVVGIAFRNQ